MARNASDTWLGGYVRADKAGRRTYIISKRIGGKLYERSTHAHTERAALAQLERFEASPDTYDARDQADAPVLLDAELVKPYLEWMASPRPQGKGVGKKHVNDTRRYLAWWADQLRGVDLRKASLVDHIVPPLQGQPARAMRIATLKALYGWLRKVRHTLKAHEDPTFGTLSVPQSTPEQWVRVKSVPREHVDLVREQLAPEKRGLHKADGTLDLRAAHDWRPHLDVLCGTAWHVSELHRFARFGEVEPASARQKEQGTAAVLVLWPQGERGSKAGDPLRTPVSAAVEEAARAVLKKGAFSREWFERAVRQACTAAEVPVFTPAQMRHTVLSWALDQGVDRRTIADFANHKSTSTQRRFYTTHATPAKVPTLR